MVKGGMHSERGACMLGERGACVMGDMLDRGTCVAWGLVWQGCMAGGFVAGGMHGRGA